MLAAVSKYTFETAAIFAKKISLLAEYFAFFCVIFKEIIVI
jgi:hypothetical protein